MSLPNHITYKPLLGPWHFSYTPFVKPLLLLLLSAHFSLLSLPLSLSLSRRPIQSINTTPHLTISPSEHVELSLRQRRLNVTSGGIGWMGLRGSEAFIRVGHSSLSPPFLVHPIYFTHLPFRSGTKRRPLFPSALGSRLWTLRATLMLCLSCLTGDARTWKCEIEDGPARDVEVRAHEMCAGRWVLFHTTSPDSAGLYVRFKCCIFICLDVILMVVLDYIFCLWIMKTSVCI